MTDPTTQQQVDELRAEYERWFVEADRRYQACNGFWESPEFAAVREALAREGVSNDYYWAWYERLTEVWRPLSEATAAAERAVRQARQAWRLKAREASRLVV